MFKPCNLYNQYGIGWQVKKTTIRPNGKAGSNRRVAWSQWHLPLFQTWQSHYLAIPTKRQIFRIINDFIFFIFTLTLTDLLFLLLLPLFPCPCLLTLHVLVSEVPLFLEREEREGIVHTMRQQQNKDKLWQRETLPQCTEGREWKTSMKQRTHFM